MPKGTKLEGGAAEAMLWETTQFQATELCGLCPVLQLPVPQSLHIHWEGWGNISIQGEVGWKVCGEVAEGAGRVWRSMGVWRIVEGNGATKRPWHMASIQLGWK